MTSPRVAVAGEQDFVSFALDSLRSAPAFVGVAGALGDGEVSEPDVVATFCVLRPTLVRAAVDDLKKTVGGIPVVVVGAESDAPPISLLDAGAVCVVRAAELERALPIAVAAAAAGQHCLPGRREGERAPILSIREKQVLGMVVLEFGNADIAARLYVAESTIKSHLNSAYRKLGVRGRREAAAAILDPQRGLGTGILTIDIEEDPQP